ncbi:MAG: 4-hydroxythreonine-4-phosphate dehydrogenase PdxA [Gammaproteobacteria bacterium]
MSKSTNPVRIAITSGEPAGIGPDLCALIAQKSFDAELVVIGDPNVIKQRAAQIEQPINIDLLDPSESNTHQKGSLKVLPLPVFSPVVTGQLDKKNAKYVMSTLDSACHGCMNGLFDAMVTAPLHKGVINDSGLLFTGHTEYLAEKSGGDHPVMMLATPKLRVALVTTHAPLSAIPGMINEQLILQVTRIIDHDLRSKFKLKNPQISVCGLNPHAGEGGHLGMEEIETIIPALKKLSSEGINIRGPLPADTAFTPQQLEQTDLVLAMYHDQGLPVLKHQGFGDAVNVTLGLPIIRTSVDHGTALDLAGTGNIDEGSLCAAIEMAIDMASIAKRKERL